jgi:dCMP deaminase
MKQIKKEKYDKVYMAVVDTLKQLSHDKKRKVAALLVRKKHIIAEGINGTPKKMSNICRDENEKTFWYVLHAEANAILKCAKKGIKTKNSTLYVSLSP